MGHAQGMMGMHSGMMGAAWPPGSAMQGFIIITISMTYIRLMTAVLLWVTQHELKQHSELVLKTRLGMIQFFLVDSFVIF